jgi:hypothetical protein
MRVRAGLTGHPVRSRCHWTKPHGFHRAGSLVGGLRRRSRACRRGRSWSRRSLALRDIWLLRATPEIGAAPDLPCMSGDAGLLRSRSRNGGCGGERTSRLMDPPGPFDRRNNGDKAGARSLMECGAGTVCRHPAETTKPVRIRPATLFPRTTRKRRLPLCPDHQARTRPRRPAGTPCRTTSSWGPALRPGVPDVDDGLITPRPSPTRPPAPGAA